jgi:hypothetical protein
VAVRADDLALLDFVENGLPASVMDFPTDIEELLAQVIELQDDGVVLSAVDARVGLEELDQIERALPEPFPLDDCSLVDVSLSVSQIVLPSIGRPAWPAHGVALDLALATPGKGVEWLKFLAATAPA